MRYRVFPATGDELSVLGFGAMGLAGWFGAIDDRDAIRALHTALDLGVNMIDTARDYGRSEQVVGAGLRSWSGTKPFVATKIQPRGPKSQYAIAPAVDDVFPKGWLTQSCETSLRKLGLDHVDLMQLHLYWPTWGQEGYWMDELQALKESGKARSVGISVPDPRHDMVISLVQSGLIDSVQTILNVFANEPLDTLIPICQAHDVAVIARCILDEGGLTGFLTEDLEFPPGDFRHIHEIGTHGPWLEEVVGTANPRLAALPPDVVMRALPFQLRAFVNAGFRSIAVISGHNGTQADLRLVASEFMRIVPVPVIVHSDPELVIGRFPGDHAGKFEISQLMYCRPELVDIARVDRAPRDPLGRFAQNPDAHEATSEYGEQIIEAMIERVGELVDEAGVGPSDPPFLSFDDMEPAWAAVEAQRGSWISQAGDRSSPPGLR